MAHKMSQLRVMLHVMVLGVIVAQPAQALSNQFPQYPLITGGGTKVLPNILLILDDSGSMRSAGIPETVVPWQRTSLSDYPRERSYIHNELYYNPAKIYKPWRTSTMGVEDRLPNADYKKVSADTIQLTGNTYNLAGHTESYFYIPRPGTPANSGYSNHRNLYDKYRISPSGNFIQRCTYHWNDCSHGKNGHGWENKLPANNQGRNHAQEIQNFANFYHYHRSRMKVAKAGVSEAFGRLDADLRVGYNNLGRTNGIKYPIPIDQHDGQFKGTNRDDFYSLVQKEIAPSGTPTREALNRAGLYFRTNDPYRTRKGSPPLSCRRNYTLLVTDGDWNGSDTQNIWTDNRVGCRNLACIAKHYWKTDLQPNLPDEVPTSGADSANWQHMNTFTISIGLKGTLNTNNPPPTGPTGRDKPLSTAWPRPVNPATKTDDMWHAAVEGRGEFIVAADTESFAKALTDTLTAINNRQASNSVLSTNSAEIKADTLLFRASFKSGVWNGDLVARRVNASGTGSASNAEWVLSQTFGKGGVNEHFKDRGITRWIYYKDNAKKINIDKKINFSQTNLNSLGKDYLALYARSSGVAAVSAEDNIAWLRGDQSKERENGGNLRNRRHPIGDIVHSAVVHVKDEVFDPANNMIFAGANDGMLHAIRARDGKVLYSYIPRGVDTTEFATLSSPNYEHRFFVDGDIDINTDYRRYPRDKHMLLGALGRGGRGVFMLSDITNETSQSKNVWVVFDHTLPPSDTTTDPNMGYVLGPVRLRRDNRARTWAIVPNGIDSPDGKAVLFAYELGNRRKYISESNIKKYELIADKDNTAKGNGLMSVSVADINGDGHFDVIYGGDLKGNVWRWDFTGEEPGEAVKIFQAKDAQGQPQPITGGLSYARESGGNRRHFIGFGTGRYISVGDMPQIGVKPQIQSLYGIIDETDKASMANTTPPLIKRDNLQKREIAYVAPNGGATRAFGEYKALPGDKKGWYLDLPAQERAVAQHELLGEAMYFISINPPLAGSDECGNGNGSSYLNAINLFTGTGAYNAASGYFSGYSSIAQGNNIFTVGSIRLDGLRAGVTLMQMPNGDVKAVTGNEKGDDGSDFEIPAPGNGKNHKPCNPIDPNCFTAVGGRGGQPQVQRVQWRSLL